MNATSLSAAKPQSTFMLLLWLKWTLLWRGYSRQKLRLVSAAILILLLVPLSIGFAVACFLFGHDHAYIVPFLCKAVLGATYVIWLITPLLGFPLNESYDPGKLFVYPVPLREIFAASVVGGLFELSTLTALPVFIALFLLFSTSFLASVLSALALLLFLFHTIALAQLVMLSLVGFLRSRRFRDITIVMFPLLAMSFYIFQQTAIRHIGDVDFFNFVKWPIWNVITFFPPGWTANAATDAEFGDYGGSLMYLGLLAVVTALPILGAAAVMRNLYLGDRGPLTKAVPSKSLSSPVPAVAQDDSGKRQPAWIAGNADIFALAQKEFTYLLREPQYKALAVNTLYTVVMVFFVYGMRMGTTLSPSSYGTDGDGAGQLQSSFGHIFDVIAAFTLPSVVLLGATPLVFNIFGGDASAITVLFSFPIKRLRLIFAKNVAYFPVVVLLGVLAVVAGALLFRRTEFELLEIVWIILATPVIIGGGNLMSIWLPHKMMVRGQRFGRGGQVSFGQGPTGCAYPFLYLACFFLIMLTVFPVAALIVAPILFDAGNLLWITIPLAAVYSGAVYCGSTLLAAGMLERREPEIVRELVPEE